MAEAVPLGTVHLQRLLDGVGVRSLVSKGPAFVALGVRAPRQSNDIDLLVHQDDRAKATEALADAGWSIISHWFPPALDATKLQEGGRRAATASRIASAAAGFEVSVVAEAATSVGARHPASPLITAMGGVEPTSARPAGYEQRLTRGARNSGRDLVRRAPTHIPSVVWQQLTLDPEIARFWAHTHRVAYCSRWQIFWLRVRRMARR